MSLGWHKISLSHPESFLKVISISSPCFPGSCTANICHAPMAEENKEKASLLRLRQCHTVKCSFQPIFEAQQRWEQAALPFLEGSLSKAPTNSSTHFTDSIIVHYLLQFHSDNLGDNTKSRETVIFILTFPQKAAFPGKALVL